MEIDGHKVISEFIAKEVEIDTVDYKVTPTFRSRHVFETQYMSVYTLSVMTDLAALHS